MKPVLTSCPLPLGLTLLGFCCMTAEAQQDAPRLVPFKIPAEWDYSSPLIAPEQRRREPSRAQKDPTVVFHDGKWHVFMTVKLPGRSAIEYCSFVEWDEATVPGLDASAYRISKGVVHVPDLPGFGLQLDEQAFARAVAEDGFVVSRR